MSTIYRPQKHIYLPNDPFFEEGNIALRSIWLQKQAQSENELEMIKKEASELATEYTSIEIYCDPCRIEFPDVVAYELHYEAVHRNVCSVCHKIFPGEEWLQLHLDEFHDVILQMKKDRGEKIHKCYVQTCTKVFSTPRMRRLHLVDKHCYPRYFPFDLVYTGTLTFEQRKLRDRKNRERISKRTEQLTADLDMMDTLAESMSKLKIPPSISFGHRPPALPQHRQHRQTNPVSGANSQTTKDIDMVDSAPSRPKRKRGPKKKKQSMTE
ncbi:hypothetical protein HMPREF1544_01714 [Mucor circinelloides 1006PhL]|uniref:C2H2-type domain-containing protein n=1 Tax=Mucor circinelloides f. circinelloides (strain 1006PhL) TaxID=1220926 RepID=S2K7P2_MUCC1|nr:hypothetical protein HMPREF1544_01714 [Mucor circinelloides 1006PhL]